MGQVGRPDGRPGGEGIEVVVSDGVPEVDTALALIHDGFVEAGYMTARPSGRRMHLSYLNPGTVFLLARAGGRPVGALALVADGPFGLPCERAFAEEVNALRAAGDRPLECGSLSLRPAQGRHAREVMIHIMATVAHLLAELPAGARAVAAVMPGSREFYRRMMGFSKIGDSRPLYGAPALLLRTDRDAVGVAHQATLGRAHALLARLAAEPEPAWLVDRRAGQPWPEEWLAPLLDEEPAHARLLRQVALLAASAPDSLAAPESRRHDPLAA